MRDGASSSVLLDPSSLIPYPRPSPRSIVQSSSDRRKAIDNLAGDSIDYSWRMQCLRCMCCRPRGGRLCGFLGGNRHGAGSRQPRGFFLPGSPVRFIHDDGAAEVRQEGFGFPPSFLPHVPGKLRHQPEAQARNRHAKAPLLACASGWCGVMALVAVFRKGP